MARIRRSVGRSGVNQRQDVLVAQNLLNGHIHALAPSAALEPDGKIGQLTRNAIVRFQRNVLHMVSPDGRIDPDGRTLRALNAPAGAAQRFQYPAGPQEPLADFAVPYVGATEGRGNRIGGDPRMREIYQADGLWQDGDTDGYPWCCSFVSLCVQHLIRQSPFYGHVQPPRTAGVRKFRTQWAPSQNCLVFAPTDRTRRPHKGDVVVFTFSHIGIVTSTMATGVRTIEGNTNEAGSREGTTVRRKERTNAVIRCFIRLPLPMSFDFTDLVCRA